MYRGGRVSIALSVLGQEKTAEGMCENIVFRCRFVPCHQLGGFQKMRVSVFWDTSNQDPTSWG